MFDLYLITDPQASGGVVESVREALRGAPPGRIAVQLRDKRAPAASLVALARELRALTRDAGARLLVNTHVELAARVDADGVHLPEGASSLRAVSAARAALRPGALVGVSCHDAAGLERAAQAAADFAVLGPVLDVPDKAPALSIPGFGALVAGARLPVLALGGVSAAHVAELCARGAHGVAVIRAVFGASDRRVAVALLLEALDRAHERR